MHIIGATTHIDGLIGTFIARASSKFRMLGRSEAISSQVCAFVRACVVAATAS